MSFSTLVSISIFSLSLSGISTSTLVSISRSYLCSISKFKLISGFISNSISFFNFFSDDFLELELLDELLELDCESLTFISTLCLFSVLISISILVSISCSYLCSISISCLTFGFISNSTSFANFFSDDFLELELLEELLELDCESLTFISTLCLFSVLVSISIFSISLFGISTSTLVSIPCSYLCSISISCLTFGFISNS